MIGLVIAIHTLICLFLIGIILVQAGRGGGLVSGLSGVESMFGPKTNTFLTRTTTVLSILFFITSVSLALLSARQSRSLIQTAPETSKPETPKPETSQVQSQSQESVPKTE